MKLPHLEQVKDLGFLLGLEYLERSESREIGRAVESIGALLRLGFLTDQEPMVVTHLIANALRTIAFNQTARLMQRERLSRDELETVREYVQGAAKANALGSAVASEVAVELEIFRMAEDELSRQVRLLASPQHPLADAEVVSQYRQSGRLGEDHLFFAEQSERFLKALRRGMRPAYEQALSIQSRLERETEVHYWLLSRPFLSGMLRGLAIEAQYYAVRETLLVALAIELYRTDHDGECPNDLEMLSPDYLLEVPRGLFRDRDLTYEKRATGYLLKVAPAPSTEDGGNAKAAPVTQEVTLQINR